MLKRPCKEEYTLDGETARHNPTGIEVIFPYPDQAGCTLGPDPRGLLVPYPAAAMKGWPIVNKPENDDASILDRVERQAFPPMASVSLYRRCQTEVICQTSPIRNDGLRWHSYR